MPLDSHDLVPLLPLRTGVLFPHVGTPIAVGRPGSVGAVERASVRDDKVLAVFGQRTPEVEPVRALDLNRVGTVALVRAMQRVDDALTVIVQGQERVVLEDVILEEGVLLARVRPAPLIIDDHERIDALARAITELIARMVKLTTQSDAAVVQRLLSPEDPARLTYAAASLAGLEPDQSKELLEMDRASEALSWLHDHLLHEVRVHEIRRDIAEQVAGDMDKQQREFLLRQQLEKIREELGESDGGESDVEELRDRIEQADLPEEARKEAERELARLRRLPAMAPDHHVVRSYLEMLLELPWNKSAESKADIRQARRVLDEDHYGLSDVKERILEHLAVLELNPRAKAPILCFLGPPGVGKTSLGQSIARALGRAFERMSLGGVHDEAELRGHRRTYVGSMPGRIIQAMRRAGVNNPLIMLDEIDKLGRDFRGDPASALLEILDPEQNVHFRDNYLDLPFDLSKVLFITTCNTIDTIPGPLLDRMEVVRLPGYTEEEKEQIALRYLLPRQLAHAGLDGERCSITPETVRHIIRHYTREAGVRQVERALAKIIRKVALRFADGETQPVHVGVDALLELLGSPRPVDTMRRDPPPGVAAGLAWTEVGGEVLYVEAAKRTGREQLVLTGHLGDVMQESAKAALTCVMSRVEQL
ncbi:MAG TPA: endopeptidase La, partial [Polyangiaceae bacterium]|nr:endopeptidase La [Polyangiaceae bacterium]